MWDTFHFTGNCPCRQLMTPTTSVQILYFWKRPWVNIYRFFCQYLTPGVIWGLYVHLRDTPGATRSFLVDITSSRVVFSAISVPRDPCDNSEMCVRARSLVMRLLSQTCFLTSDVTCDPWKWTNTVCETGIKSSCVGIGQKTVSVKQKRPRPWWSNILLCDSGIEGSFSSYHHCSCRRNCTQHSFRSLLPLVMTATSTVKFTTTTVVSTCHL